jgi:hypothetical protein
MRRFVTVTMAVASIAPACFETRYETQHFPVRKKTEAVTCDSPFVKPDLAKLKPCHGGGHCYDKNKQPIPASELFPCDGDEVCVPDKLLVAAGEKLRTCRFFLGDKPGACMSTLIKRVGDVKDQLQQDSCDADERCSPCINPLDGKETFACSNYWGVHEADCKGGGPSDEGPPACCHGMGVCMTEASAPPDAKAEMKRDACPERYLCVPASMADGNPVKCDVLGLSGVCIDTCFAAMFAGTSHFTRANCQPTEICMPCAIGASRGLLGCD